MKLATDCETKEGDLDWACPDPAIAEITPNPFLTHGRHTWPE